MCVDGWGERDTRQAPTSTLDGCSVLDEMQLRGKRVTGYLCRLQGACGGGRRALCGDGRVGPWVVWGVRGPGGDG